jgi:hypothetical protein
LQKVFTGAFSFLAATLGLAGCQEAGPSAQASTSPAALPAPSGNTACADDAYLEGSILGAINADLAWTPDGLACDGGPRPDGEGIRLSFARSPDDGPGLTVIIALPTLEKRATGQDLHANVTIIVEGEARFFSTQNRDTCWAAVSANDNAGGERYSIAGEVYCIGALAEVNGDASVTIDGLNFRSRVDWESG